MKPCHCGSSAAYDECCGPLIRGERPAASPEQLMRSRYSAYVEKEIGYLRSSLHPGHRADYDEKSSREWAERAEWHSLTILNSTGGGPGEDEGTVEFVVAYSEKGVLQEHRELATFAKEGGNWYFVSGKNAPRQPVVRAAPKVGRNDPCACGSGRKSKKCCAGAVRAAG